MGLGKIVRSLFLLSIIIAAGVYYFLQQGDFESLQTQHQFKIWRDEQGIPRIYAKDKLSSFFALGFAEAQDRLWTLHLNKRIFQGRLAEIFGPEALTLDMQNRNYNFYGIGKMNQKGIGEQERKWVQAYCDGINAYAKNVKFLPFQFYLMFTQWEDWEISDTLSMVGLLSYTLQFDWMYELSRQRLLETVGFDLAWKMMPFGTNNLFRQVTIMNNDQVKEQGRYKQYDSSKIENILREHWVNRTMPIGSIHMPSTDYQSLGSNAWVIGGQHTKNGKPLLANDPHLGLLIPSLFYMVQINLVDQQNKVVHSAFGAKANGLPALSIGINNYAAWGSTASYIDNKDVFHEVVRDNNGTLQYLFKGEWHELIKRQEIFKVRGSQEVQKNYYHTHRGPAIEDLFMDIHLKYGYPIPNQYRINRTLTFTSAMYQPDFQSLKGLSSLAFATDFESFEKASSLIQVPNIDSVFATVDGKFGYGAVGRTPKREVPEMGGFVKDGTTDLYDMKQYLKWQQMPKLRNPKKGYVCMANNKFADDSFDSRNSIHELSTGRSYRLEKIITEKIRKNEKFQIQDMKKMQLDTKDQFLSEAFPLLLSALDKVRYIWENKQTAHYYELLRKWDYFMPTTSVQASIYHVFEHEFHQTLLHGTALSQQERQAILNHAFFEVYYMKLHQKIGSSSLTDQEAVVCSNPYNANYTDIHPCLANAALSFKKLPQLLFKIFGTKDVAQYQWGKIHKHVFKAIPWSELPVLKKIWGREVAAGGNSRTLNVGILTHQTKSYISVGGPVFRFITDLNQTYFSFDTGQTDRVSSEYYDNFLGKDLYIKYEQKNPILEKVEKWKRVIDKFD